MSSGGTPSASDPRDELVVRLRLYVARSTPNSARAEYNLLAALANLESKRASSSLEIIDVFSQPKRAITDGVIVTPTLIGSSFDKRVVLMGDLADRARLEGMLQDLLTSRTERGV
jgi:circadian clock protein KaiB